MKSYCSESCLLPKFSSGRNMRTLSQEPGRIDGTALLWGPLKRWKEGFEFLSEKLMQFCCTVFRKCSGADKVYVLSTSSMWGLSPFTLSSNAMAYTEPRKQSKLKMHKEKPSKRQKSPAKDRGSFTSFVKWLPLFWHSSFSLYLPLHLIFWTDVRTNPRSDLEIWKSAQRNRFVIEYTAE